MLCTVFENAIFLQSLGWAILHSFWQAAILWLLYKSYVYGNKNASAILKYSFSLVLTFVALGWFILTAAQSYRSLIDAVDNTNDFATINLLKAFQLNNILPFIAAAYCFALGFQIAKFFRQYIDVKILKSGNLVKAPVDIRLFLQSTAHHLGIKKNVQVWVSEKADVPSVIGFFKPVILLPAAMLSHLTVEQTEAVLLHELAHIKRNDYLLNLLQSMAELVLFFNPFVKLLSKVTRQERENCCDDWVLNYRYDHFQYATALLTLEEKRVQNHQLLLAATNGKSNLLLRIKRLFQATPQTSLSRKQRLSFATLIVFFGIAVAFFPTLDKEAIRIEQPIAKSINRNTIFSPAMAMAKPVVYRENLPMVTIINDQPQTEDAIEKTTIAEKDNKKAIEKSNDDKDYSLALVNEELMDEPQEESIATSIANINTEVSASVYVTVEEEVSGQKQKNTYYLEVNTDKGQTNVKPLIILKKYKANLKRQAAERTKDSIRLSKENIRIEL